MKTRDVVALILTIVGMVAGGVVFAYSSFETKDQNKVMHAASDAKLDMVIDMIKRIEYKLDRRK
jgi:hypothetical protein